ncbi:MAG TPA: glycosyltransferase family 1 protein [Lutibacter sp.]|nr:glycosyltransferase family 1 protein [Lutibacter sp.]
MKIGYDAKRIFHNTTGLGNYSRDLVQILSRYYPKNQYFLYNPKPAKVDRLKPDGKTLVEIKPTSFLAKKMHFLWRSKWIVKQLVKDKITVFHGLTGELPYGIEKTDIKTIVTIHDLIFVRYPKLYKSLDRKIYLKKFKYAAQTADIVIAISEQTKRDIIDFLGVKSDKIKVIYQGCHPIFKENIFQELQNEILKKHNIPKNFILNVGAINERKNLLSLIKAIEKTGDSLVVVGNGTDYFQKVKDYVTQHNLNNKVRFLQNLTMQEIAVLYRKANLFVYPSIFEGFGIPIIEALYSKTPVITTQGSCFPEAGGPDTLYLKDSYDIKELQNKIELIKNDSQLKNRMIKNGYNFVQKFNDEHIAKYFNSVYSI